LQDLKGEIPFAKKGGIFPDVCLDNVLRKETDPRKCTAVGTTLEQRHSDMTMARLCPFVLCAMSKLLL